MKTRQEIAGEIFEQCKKEIPQVSHFKSGGVFRLFIEIIASFLEKLYQESESLLANRFLQTASGDYLTLKAKELGIEGRFPAQKTQGYVVFSRNKKGNNLTIDANKIIATKANSQGQVFRFKVLEIPKEIILKEDQLNIRVLVEAEECGSSYNVPVGTITEFVTHISGIEKVSNSETKWITKSGRDLENDDDLRIRCLSIWQGLSGANEGAYIAWAKSISDIEEVKVIGTSNGIYDDVSGSVFVICTSKGNADPSPDIIKKVQTVIESKKPVASKVTVQAPKNIFIPLKIIVTTSTPIIGQDALSTTKIAGQVKEYFSTQSIGQDFEPSALIAHLFRSSDITSVVINTPTTSVPISDYQIARQDINTKTDITILATKE